MKKINYCVFLSIGVLSLNGLSSCVATREKMFRDIKNRNCTVGNLRRSYNRNPKKFIAGSVVGSAAFLGISGLAIYSLSGGSLPVCNTDTKLQCDLLYNTSMQCSVLPDNFVENNAYLYKCNNFEIGAKTIGQRIGPYRLTPLMYAVEGGCIEDVKHIIDNNTEIIDAQDDNGLTALMHAVLLNKLSSIKLLIEKADVNLQSSKGLTALMYAAMFNRLDAAKLLIEKADANIKDLKGRNAFMYAAACSYTDIAKLLIQKSNPNAKDHKKQTALMYALRFKSTDLTKLLIEQKANIYAQDCKGKTPLMHAIEGNKIEFAKLLIGNKTNIDLKDNSGRDALTYATTCNRKDFIDLLKNNSTNLNT